jgi:hypothetical protein
MIHAHPQLGSTRVRTKSNVVDSTNDAYNERSNGCHLTKQKTATQESKDERKHCGEKREDDRDIIRTENSGKEWRDDSADE